MGERTQRVPYRERLETRAQRLVAVAAGITAVIGLPLAINALIDTFWRDDSIAVARSATLSVERPEQINLTWGGFTEQYRDEVPRKAYSRAQLDTYGLVLPVRIMATGLAGKKATLRWTVVDPTGAAGNYDPPSWVPQSREIRPSSSPEHVTAHVWVPPSKVLEEQIVLFTLIDDRGSELARKESQRLQREPEPS